VGEDAPFAKLEEEKKALQANREGVRTYPSRPSNAWSYKRHAFVRINKQRKEIFDQRNTFFFSIEFKQFKFL
jgi:phage pi2 protein 07